VQRHARVADIILSALRGRLRLVRVAGDSMTPTFATGALLLVIYPRDAAIRLNTIVTCNDPQKPGRVLVKRVVNRLDDLVELAGDNSPASTDSRHFGLVRVGVITGVVAACLSATKRGR